MNTEIGLLQYIYGKIFFARPWFLISWAAYTRFQYYTFAPEVGGTNFWVLESESGIMPKTKRIRYWIRDSEMKLNETKSETKTKKKP